jgi:hypothetical protein
MKNFKTMNEKFEDGQNSVATSAEEVYEIIDDIYESDVCDFAKRQVFTLCQLMSSEQVSTDQFLSTINLIAACLSNHIEEYYDELEPDIIELITNDIIGSELIEDIRLVA